MIVRITKMSEDKCTVIFYHHLPDKIVYTILVCPSDYKYMKKTEYVKLIKDKPYTPSIKLARCKADEINRTNNIKYDVQECFALLDIDESLIFISSNAKS